MTNTLRNPEFELLVSTWELAFWSPGRWPQLNNVLTCAVAVMLKKILPVGVRGTKNVWCLSSLLFSVTLPGVTKWPTEKLLQNSRKNKTNLCLESPDLKGSVILLYFHFSRDRENTANQKQFRFFFSENKFHSENRWPNDWRCAFLALFFLH